MRPVKKFLFTFFILLVVLSAVYAPALFGYYAHHDDYVYFVGNTNRMGLHPFSEGELSNGRYFASVFYSLFGLNVRFIDDLNFLRFCSVVFFALSGWICHLFLYQYLRNYFHSILTAICIFTLPPFQVIVSWAMSAGKIPALFLACLSFYFVSKGMDSSCQFPKWVKTRYLGAIVLFVGALSTYPPGAMFFWFLLALYVLTKRFCPLPIGTPDSRTLPFWGVGLSSMGIYFGMVQVFKSVFGKFTNVLYNPYTITTDAWGKAVWFVKEPFFNALNLWNIFPDKYFSLVVLSLIFLGIVIYMSRFCFCRQPNGLKNARWRYLVTNLLSILFLLVLSFAPNLLAVGDAAFYRCSLALTPMVFLICLWALMVLVSLLPQKVRTLFITTVLFSAALYGSCKAYTNVLYCRVIPSHKELAYVKDQLRRKDLYMFNRVHFIRPDEEAYKKIRRYDEFGVPSTHYRQNIPYVFKCALREIGLEPFFWKFYPHITQSGAGEFFKEEKNTLIIDMSKMRY